MTLHTRIILGLLAGAVSGILANTFFPDEDWVRWIGDNLCGPLGQIFLRLLLMTVIPLVFASITLGVAGIGDIRKLGRMGFKTLAYFLLSTGLSVLVGLLLVNLIEPGAAIDEQTRTLLFDSFKAQAEGLQAADTRFGVNTFVAVIPRNPVRAAADMDMLAVIFFSLVFGAALTQLPAEKAQRLLGPIETLGDVVLKIIDLAMKLAPYGVFGLIFVVTSRFGWHLLERLGVYVLVVVVGLALHAAVSLSLLVRYGGGIRVGRFWRAARPSIVTAFSTSSSNATLPTNLKVAEEGLGIPARIAGFVLPLGATMNMNGTALYEGITVLFLAQVFGVPLSLTQQVIVMILSVITAVGTAGVPGGSLPLIMVVLGSVGVPPESIAIILGVDRILDMARTVVNVTGDLTAAAYLARSEKCET